MKAEIQHPTCHLCVAGETVKDATNVAASFLTKNGERVRVSLARVDDDRPSELAGKPNLAPKDTLLDLARSKIVMVIEAYLTDRSGRGKGVHPSPDGGLDFVLSGDSLIRLMRVNTNRKQNFRPERFDPLSLADVGWVGQIYYTKRTGQPHCPSPPDDCLKVGRERLVAEVTVRVNQGLPVTARLNRVAWPPRRPL